MYKAILVFTVCYTSQSLAQTDLTADSRYIFSMETAYLWQYRKPYPDAGITEEKKLAYSISPKILFVKHRKFNYGLQYKYQEYLDLVNQTRIIPPIHALGVLWQYNTFLNQKKKWLVTCESAFMMNNYAPLSKQKTEVLHSRYIKFPEIRMNTIVGYRIFPKCYLGMGIVRSYHFKTNKLYLFKPGESFLLLSYHIH